MSLKSKLGYSLILSNSLRVVLKVGMMRITRVNEFLSTLAFKKDERWLCFRSTACFVSHETTGKISVTYDLF